MDSKKSIHLFEIKRRKIGHLIIYRTFFITNLLITSALLLCEMNVLKIFNSFLVTPKGADKICATFALEYP